MYHSVSTGLLVLLDIVIITQLNRHISHVPNIMH